MDKRFSGYHNSKLKVCDFNERVFAARPSTTKSGLLRVDRCAPMQLRHLERANWRTDSLFNLHIIESFDHFAINYLNLFVIERGPFEELNTPSE